MTKKLEWYHEFIDLKHNSKPDDMNVLYYYEPRKGISDEDAIGRVASESSSGTWTTLSNLPAHLAAVKAYAYYYKDNFTKIAYPRIILEDSSVPALMSGIGGNIYGMKAVDNLRLVDAELPLDYVKTFKGPVYGTDVIKKIFRRKHGPVTSVVPKPKLGYTSKEHAEFVGYQVWKGGVDCVKDDENLTNQKFNRFAERVKLLARTRDKVMKETGDVKDAFINCTAPTLKELERRVRLVHDHGFQYFMIDMVVSGFTAVGSAAELAHDYKMAIHGHRAMHAMFDRNPKHGMTMLFLAKLMRLIGVDQLHTGTVLGKLEGDKAEIMAMKDMLMEREVDEISDLRMPQKWGKIKPTMPVTSGGLHPGLIPAVLDIYGTMDIGIQAGGGTQGHPDGIEAGARALMQSVEAYKEGMTLEDYAKTHKELARALEKWGHLKPV